MMMNNRQGVNVTKYKSRRQFIGIKAQPMIAEYPILIIKNVETMADARCAASFV